VVKAKGHVPFLDMAYQGFGDGIAEDAFAVRLFAESGLEFFVSSSFSKSFSLVRRARRRTVGRHRLEGRKHPRAVAGQARDPHNLLQPADPRRDHRRHRAKQR
jgi:Aspartate/tyrosine/aromatic aminotransferase